MQCNCLLRLGEGLAAEQAIARTVPSRLAAQNGICFPRSPAGSRNASRQGNLQIVCAKKKGKSGKGGQKKGPGSLMDIPKPQAAQETPTVEPWQETEVIMNNLLLVESYSRNVGRPLLEGDVEMADIAQALWDAPFVLLAHDLPEEGSSEQPVFSYANRAALDLFETEWGELIGKPSSISADKDAQEDRSNALSKALEGGKAEGYSGWRRSLKSTRFQIKGATLFNISSPSGEVLGQGAKIGQWEFEDGRQGGPDAPPEAAPEVSVSATEVADAESAVEQQASAVRELKEGQGLGNEDQAVKEAVAELLKRKQKLQGLQDQAAAASSAS